MSRTRESDALVPLLERMRVAPDGVLVVHSAIATLSRRGFRAEAMIETFLDYMSNGTVVMPTMSWRTVTRDHPHWDEIETRSETGVLSEIFRTRYASRRSIHPTHSVAAHGAKARRSGRTASSRRHAGLIQQSVWSDGTYQAYVLMIGVGLETCTAIHLAEETIAPDVYLRPLDPSELYQCRDRDRPRSRGPHPAALAARSRLSAICRPAGTKRLVAIRQPRRLRLHHRRAERSVEYRRCGIECRSACHLAGTGCLTSRQYVQLRERLRMNRSSACQTR